MQVYENTVGDRTTTGSWLILQMQNLQITRATYIYWGKKKFVYKWTHAV